MPFRRGCILRRAVLCLLLACAGTHARADLPTLGPIASSDTGAGVGMYQKLELTFSVTTGALNPQLPFDPIPPPYAANLQPDEDARLGVSVDALFLPPGETDWAQAKAWPAFLYRNYVRTSPGAHKAQVENLVWAGPDTWKVRFAPTAPGRWQYRLRVTDAGGTALSEPQVFVCVSSASHGFVRVSPTDARYLQFDTGEPACFVGTNAFFNGLENWQAYRAGISQTGASALVRLWIAGRSGLEVIGGFANSGGGRSWNFGSEPALSSLVTEDAHSGRFSVQVNPGGFISTGEIPVRPGHAHTLSVWVKPVNLVGDAPQITVASKNADTYQEGATVAFPMSSLAPDARGWTLLTVPVPAYTGADNLYAAASVTLSGASGGHLLVDDITLTDTATGMDALEIGDFERHVHYSQRQSWLLDAIVDDCAATNQYLRLNCLENDDSVFCNVSEGAANGMHTQGHFFGGSDLPGADTPVRRWQKYYARYLMARWGYSTAVAQWEFNNEGPPAASHYAAAEDFARAIHAFGAEGRHLCSSSFYQNASGTSFATAFFTTPALYPDVDYADLHYYPSTGVAGASYTPFEGPWGGFKRSPSGGPGALGALHLDGLTTVGQPQNTQLPVSRIHGRGTWTVSFQARADSAARMNWFGCGPHLELWATDLGLASFAIPAVGVSPPLPPGYEWRTYSRTFTVPDDAPYTIRIAVFGNTLTGGAIDFADIKIIAPTGRIWAYYPFNEPLMEHDSASLAQYLGLEHTSLSGDPCLGMPLSVGETDFIAPDGSYNSQIKKDMAGTYLRQFAWAHLNASGATVFLYNFAGDDAQARGLWKFVAAYQAFLKGIPFANGQYRNVEALASNPNIIIIGQKDVSAGRAQIFVYNKTGNWFALSTNPTAIVPVTGTVSIPGLRNGAYTVETWDTAQGTIKSMVTLSSAGGALVLPVTALTGDTAFKITRQ